MLTLSWPCVYLCWTKLPSIGPMLAHIGPSLTYVGLMLAHVGPMLAHLGLMLAHLGRNDVGQTSTGRRSDFPGVSTEGLF